MTRGAMAIILGLAALPAGPARSAEAPPPEHLEFFETKIRPLLVERCVACHGPDKQKGGLRLDSPDAMRAGGDTGPAIEPGDPDASPLVEAVRYDGGVRMPPDGKLDDAQVAALSRWVKLGAPWTPAARPTPPSAADAPGPRAITDADRQFWAFRPIADPPLPPVRDAAWPRTSVDAFLLARLEDAGLRPAPEADRRTLIRRVTFDLTGLPPTPEEVEAFVADPLPDAYERLVDRLLASPRYGERWARHWLDLARYAEDQAHSFKPRLYPSGFRYRDWLVDALNADMPYDRFVAEQIAADLLPGPDRRENLPALGFFACGPVYYGDAKGFDQLDDRVDTLTRGVLGLTVACARCHDHKYDPVTAQDYYALAGVFASSKYDETPLAPPEEVAARQAAEQLVQEQEAAIAAFLKAEADRLKQSKERVERKLDDAGKAKLADLRAELKRRQDALPPMYPVAHALVEGKPTDLPVLVRGNPNTPGPEAPRRFLAILGGTDLNEGSGRLALARAIASPDNPLTARVIVNRLWQHHFGRGLVGTPSNFGSLGERPSHPELLDHLATRLIAEGWSLKALHKLMVTSAAYRQSGRAEARAVEADPENRLVGRMSRRRLEVEAWRDALLAAAGRLDLTLGGPSRPLDDAKNTRRTLYAVVSRHDLHPLLRLFDFPDPNITAGERTRTTVPLQQLVALNDGFMVDAARDLAARLEAEAGPDPAAQVDRAYALLFGRAPTDRERQVGLAYLAAPEPDADGSSDLPRPARYAQALLLTNEFFYVD